MATDRDTAIVLYKRLIDAVSGVELKGKSMLYTSANGYMFSQVNKAGEVGIRLSKADQQAFLGTYESGPFRSYGAVMRDYVLVPDDLLERPGELAPYLAKSFAYVCSLEPNPTKKKGKK